MPKSSKRRERSGAPAQTRSSIRAAAWHEFLRSKFELPVSIQPEDVANIQYTSGTTGLPKGVMLTHRNQINNGKLLAMVFRYTNRDRICVPVPMYHCFGLRNRDDGGAGKRSCDDPPPTGPLMHAPLWRRYRRKALHRFMACPPCSSGAGRQRIQHLQSDESAYGDDGGRPCPVEVMRQVMTEMRLPE